MPAPALAINADRDPAWNNTIHRGLEFLARTQASRGQWNTPPYPTALSALAGLAMLCSGSTSTQALMRRIFLEQQTSCLAKVGTTV